MRRYVFGGAVLALAVVACGRDGTMTAPAAPRMTGTNAIGTDPVSGATIETNQDDYVPGEVVHVSGRGWAPNETVRLHMTEEPDNHPDVTMDVRADGSGTFSVHFYDVQKHDWGVVFTLVATGLASGSSATATFTDGRTVLSVVRSPQPAPPGSTVNVTVTTNLDGTVGATAWNGTAWTISGAAGVVAGPVCVNTPDHALGDGHADDAHVAAFTITAPNQDGFYTFTIATHSTDDCADPNSDNMAVVLTVTTPANSTPAVSAGGPYAGAEGSPLAIDGASASDPDGDQLTYAWSYAAGTGVDAGAVCSFNDPSVISPVVTCTDDGQYTLTLTVTDGQNPVVSASATLVVANVAPVVAIAPLSQSLMEGESVTFSATITDPGANDVIDAFAWSAAGASCAPMSGASANSATYFCSDNGTGVARLVVTDDDGGATTSDASLHVANVAPTISVITLSPVREGNVYSISEPFDIAATFSDPGTADAHVCTTTAARLNSAPTTFGPVAAAGTSCSTPIAGLPEGVYNVTFTVTDKDGGSDAETFQVVVYEPVLNGFVTGGGWIESPAGAYAGDPSATGKATFGFASKYQKGVPSGSTQFVFHVADFRFRSGTYEMLVVNQGGSNAQFKGTGTVNGVSGYTFMVFATDGLPDRFRIKIWNTVTGDVVYDNGSDTQVQGSIVVHVVK